MAGVLDGPTDPTKLIPLGLPYGAKPRLFQSYIRTKAIKRQSRVIPVERSMTAMIHELGFEARSGKRGSINSFKEQINRFARCRFDIVVLDGDASTQTYSPSGRGRGEGQRGAGRALAGAILPYAEVQTGIYQGRANREF